MKRILVLAIALSVSTGALAQLYKWVDKDGRVTYSDQPPPAQESKQLNIGTGQPAPPRTSSVERDKELEKSRLEAKEKAKVAENVEKKAQLEEENCNRAKAYLRTVTDGGRIATYDEKGERVLLDDKQIEAERVKAQKAVDESCKSP
ncbi:MAG TPA: DUF4124 domain-containing protein [Usitatibacteraceae bacterium]|nr:DUF4124 domain-containing protein [Usitatibacteraceae bacterium]